MSETYLISRHQLRRFIETSRQMQLLQGLGVDNWEHYAQLKLAVIDGAQEEQFVADGFSKLGNLWDSYYWDDYYDILEDYANPVD
jgi:hypothetical protein